MVSCGQGSRESAGRTGALLPVVASSAMCYVLFVVWEPLCDNPDVVSFPCIPKGPHHGHTIAYVYAWLKVHALSVTLLSCDDCTADYWHIEKHRLRCAQSSIAGT